MERDASALWYEAAAALPPLPAAAASAAPLDEVWPTSCPLAACVALPELLQGHLEQHSTGELAGSRRPDTVCQQENK